MEITGEVKFGNNSAPDVLPENSHLTVKFEDVSLMDAPSVRIGESVVDVTNIYKKGEPLTYSIKCPKPSPIHFDYSVSAVLNVGWKADGNNWIRKGDYLNDTRHHVELEAGKNVYKMDIELLVVAESSITHLANSNMFNEKQVKIKQVLQSSLR